MDTSGKLNSLMRETEELLERIADERAQQSLEQTKSAIEDEVENGKANGGRPQQHVGVRDLAGSLNDYVRRYPWLALATGVLVASSIGILATHATKRSYNHGS
jgi:ElaB/YqjD/DUF883 family membrane-anchored ribosome-binding protein